MKTRDVDFITSDEEHLRARIFDGEIPLDAAGAEIIRMLRAENALLHRQLVEARGTIKALLS